MIFKIPMTREACFKPYMNFLNLHTKGSPSLYEKIQVVSYKPNPLNNIKNDRFHIHLM